LGLVKCLSETRLEHMRQDDCIFCKIAAKETPTLILGDSEHALAFKDISPLAPVHLLVISKDHFRDAVELTANAPEVLADLMQLATHEALQYTDGSFRLQFNTGASAGQTVFHAHLHILSDSPKGGN
jgi:histidine triad (HIT) family protein